ncbi:hypothetical protein Hanom_Chr16g01470941 [Helianthus anomalus]
MSLSTPIPSSPIPPTILPLFEAIDIQTQSSPPHQHIPESIKPEMTVSEPVQYAIPELRRLHPLSFTKLLEVVQVEQLLHNVESTDLHLDSSFISKTPLKATNVEVATVTSALVGSPQNQEKGAFVSNDMESSPVIKTNTTTSGGNSNDPIKLGDELRYR